MGALECAASRVAQFSAGIPSAVDILSRPALASSLKHMSAITQSGIRILTDWSCADATASACTPQQQGRMRLTGGSIAYTLAGTGPALLLIHGLGGTRKTWRYLIDDLAAPIR